MKILLVFEYEREARGFLKASGMDINKTFQDIYPGMELSVFINKKRGMLNLIHGLYRSRDKFKPDLVINGGLCGSIGNDASGTVFEISQAVAVDLSSMKALYHPVKCDLKSENSRCLITVPELHEGFREEWLYFGTLLDMEGYYVLDWGKENGIPVMCIKEVSDNNSDAVKGVKSSDCDALGACMDRVLRELSPFAEIEYGMEILKMLKWSRSRHEDAARLSEFMTLNKMSFTRRMRLYDDIRTGNSLLEMDSCKHKKENKEKKKSFLFVERQYAKNSIFPFPGKMTKVIIEDYLDLFQNKSGGGRNTFIAEKRGETVKKTPEDYGPDGYKNYAVTAGYNCPYDCKYCYLQGNIRSRDPVLFLNMEQMWMDMQKTAERKGKVLFHFGDMYDALAYDHITGLLYYMAERLCKNMYGEFRTKSANTGHLSGIKPNDHIALGWSIAPRRAADEYEKGAPSVRARLNAAREAAEAGWNVSVHMDPVIARNDDYKDEYNDLLQEMKSILSPELVTSVSVGTLRLNKNSYKDMMKKEDRAYLLNGMVFSNGMYRYPEKKRKEITDNVMEMAEMIYRGKCYVCMD